jgi:sulfatase maturation enzyme AslB (radical SAM superfamily)
MKKPPFPYKVCSKPFKYFEISSPREGEIPCYSCCPTILPKETGNLAKQDFHEVWNSESYQEIRKSIIDSNYKFCNHALCPEIQSDNLLDIGALEKAKGDGDILKAIEQGIMTVDSMPDEINLSYDPVCNLACPSCRTDYITNNSKEDDALMERITEQLLSLDLSKTKLIVCSSGDPFVSQHFRKLLFDLDGSKNPGMRIQLMTNGLMFTKQAWEKMHKIHQNIMMSCISIDAATEETYAITRKGGNWQTLHKNLEFISLLRQRGELPFLRLDFVVQDHNFREIPAFVEMGKKYGVDQVFFQKVANWGTFSQEEYKARCIYDESHPKFDEFYKIITDPALKDDIVNPGNFGHWIGPVKKAHKFNLKNAIFHSIRKRTRILRKLI